MPGTFYGIGVGPGDPELLTVRAVRLLGAVDLVAVPVAGKDKPSTARRIAGPYLGPGCRVLEVDFPMTDDRSTLEEAWEAARSTIRAALDRGQSTAFLTLGDPMLYSTYIYLYHHLGQAGYRVSTVPGITSFSAAAAVSGVPLTMGEEKLAVLPGTAVLELEAGQGAGFDTLVIFKAARYFDRIVAALDRAGRLKGSVLVVNCGLPEERIVTDLQAVVGEKLPYFSLIISRREPLV